MVVMIAVTGVFLLSLQGCGSDKPEDYDYE